VAEPSGKTGAKGAQHKLYEDFRAALEREIQRLNKKCKVRFQKKSGCFDNDKQMGLLEGEICCLLSSK